MLIWPLRIWTPAALSTASSTVLTARRAISSTVTWATLVTGSPKWGTLLLTTSSGVSSSGDGLSVKSARAESATVTVVLAGE